jgi:amino acid adenylation domain-containing protein
MNAQELKLESMGTRNDTAKYDLTLYVTETGAWRAFDIQYNTDLFDDETIARLLRRYEVLLNAIVANPNERISRLEVLPHDERRRQLKEWNDTRAEYPRGCVHELFEQQAASTPDAEALVFGDERLTYEELNRRANQLAHYLRALGVGPEVAVALCVERSVEMIVGLLGILKAGGYYVPLDPAYPRQRLRFMLEDSQARVLLTQESLAAELSGQATEMVCLDLDWPLIAAQGVENVGGQAEADNLAYVIYTSGSTGRPKGVMIEHGSVVNLLAAMRREPGLTDRDTQLALTTLSFDIASLELWLPLTVGGRVVVASREEATDAARLQELLVNSGATVMQATPATWWMLQEAGWPGDPRLKVLCGGEALPRRLADGLLELAGESWNMYGPTETTIYSMCSRIVSGEREVSIGRPIANTQVYVLDERMEPAPVGVAGEFYIGGDGLARGYFNRPELTAERFVPDPFGAEPGARLYRTGDLVRYLADGQVEYLGRLDHQVKVRGFRIELGEIEAALVRHPSVEHAAVVAREVGEGDKQLIGYVVAKPGQKPTHGELRGYLKERLPEYMMPSAFFLLDELPRTSNGKLNRAALPGGERLSLDEEGVRVAPRNALESQLARIWEDLLNVRPLGVTQSFFELGGHSLLAVRLMARIHKEIGPDLPVSALFHGETIEGLARIITRQGDSLRASPLVPIQPRGGGRPFFCVHGIGGNVNNFYHLARHLGAEQPFYGLQAPGLHEAELEYTPIEEIAARYIEAVRGAQREGPYLLGGYSFGSYVAFEMARQLRAQGEETALVALLDTYAPSVVNKLPEKRDVADQLVTLAWVTSRERGQNLLLPVEELQRLDFEEQLEFFLDAMRRADLASPEIDHQLLRRFLKGYEARQKAAFSYAPGVYDGRLTVFRCRERDELFVERLKRAGVDAVDPSLGWGEFSTGPVEVEEVPGHHDVMCNEPYVAGLAERLAACISRAEAEQALSTPAGEKGRVSK